MPEVGTEFDFKYANPEIIKDYYRTELNIKIENSLQKGKDKAIKMKTLKVLVGKKDERAIREAISEMRLQGHLIMSDSTNGYWYAETYEDFKTWADFMYSYIQKISHEVKIMGESAGAKFGQYYQPPLF